MGNLLDGADYSMNLVMPTWRSCSFLNNWGLGHMIYRQIIGMAFSKMNLTSVTAFLPVTRRQGKSMQRLGFIKDGETELCGNRFIRYRLYAHHGE
jgi:hypothetical protein